MKLAIATCAKQMELSESDKSLIGLFAAHNIIAEPAIWNDSGVSWQAYHAVLIRSIWDYHLHQNAFGVWLDMLEQKGIYTLNPVVTVRQNTNKFYLRQLQQMGIEIIPTIFLSKTERLNLSVVKELGWQRLVIKPAVSASAYLTRVFDVNEVPIIEREYKQVALNHELLVQPFINEVKERGEISLLYFNRRYSHAVLKVPQPADFRVQREYGGITTPYEPDKSVLATAEKILSKIEGELLYARVDGVLVDGRFVLMELELIEPYLFFDYSEGSMEVFVSNAAALVKKYSKQY